MNTSELTMPASGLEQEGTAEAGRRLSVRTIAMGAVALAALAATAQLASGPAGQRIGEALGWRAAPGQALPPAVTVSAHQQQVLAALTVDDQKQIVVEGQLAQQRNAAIQVSGLPLEKVRGFLLAGAERAVPTTALTCLAQAVYYEAGFEPATGKRAVAQVVLNRMRHPAYPKSVCGVVYQGSERRTGCQFSFTCDGSLLRPPAAAAWQAATAVARAALSGYVEPTVGTATHYHADYVLPKWAFQLAKIDQIGAHIFYRFRGGWGTSKAFAGAYSGIERIPSVNYGVLREREAEGDARFADLPPAESLAPGLTVAPHVTDRHDPRDVGGRINVTKLWRLNIPDPTDASKGYRATLEAQALEDDKPLPVSNSAASALPEE